MKQMRKVLVRALRAVPVAVLAISFLGCPTAEDEKTSSPTGNQCQSPKLPAAGEYLANTVIPMESKTEEAVIYYTLDGSTPTEQSREYSVSSQPKMTFGGGPLTVKAVAIAEGYRNSEIVERVYTEYRPVLSYKVAALFANASGDGSESNPKRIVIPADMTLDDMLLTFPDPAQPGIVTVKDGLGQLFLAANNQFFELDFSQANISNWLVSGDNGPVPGIPGCNSSTGINSRASKDKLLAIQFPATLVIIGERAFMDSTKLKKVDLNGLNKLVSIEQYAFHNIYEATEIDFTGCTELVNIKDYAFSRGHKLRYIDFTPCVKLETIGSSCFYEPRSAKWIEFPASIKTLLAYQFHDGYSLEYVRFHGDVNPYWDWCQFNYHDWQHTWNGSGEISKEYNGLTSIHRAEGVDGEYSDRTDHMFVIYHPNTLTYTRWRSGYYSADDDGYYFIGQSVAESSPGTKGQYPSANEIGRGLVSITVNASGLSVQSGTVTNNVGAASGTISGGAISSYTIGTPVSSVLQSLNPETGQAITGLYDARENDDWGGATSEQDKRGDYGPNTGKLGKPWISDTSTQFVILDLSVGTQKLVQSGIGAYGDQVWQREVMYVYVDRPVVVTRVMRPRVSNVGKNLSTLSLSLRAGWNMVEKVDTAHDNPNGGSLMYWISGGVYDVTDEADKANAKPAADTTTRPIPWVIK